MDQLQSPGAAVTGTDSSLGSLLVGNGAKSRLGNRTHRRRLRQAGIFITVWTITGIAGSVHCYFNYAALGHRLSWPRAFAVGMSLWYAWAILSLVIYQWTRLFPLEAPSWPHRLALHIGAGIVFALTKLVMDYPIIKFIYCPEPELL